MPAQQDTDTHSENSESDSEQEQEYVDREGLDFDAEDDLNTGTAVEGGTKIPGPHDQWTTSTPRTRTRNRSPTSSPPALLSARVVVIPAGFTATRADKTRQRSRIS